MTPPPVAWSSGYRAAGLVALGGALGTAARFLLTELVPTPGFPLVTLLINVAGAFLLGLLVELLARLTVRRPGRATALRLLLGTGMLGGFTTYSALAVDTVTLGSVPTAALYAGGTLVLGLAAAAAGTALGRRRS